MKQQQKGDGRDFDFLKIENLHNEQLTNCWRRGFGSRLSMIALRFSPWQPKRGIFMAHTHTLTHTATHMYSATHRHTHAGNQGLTSSMNPGRRLVRDTRDFHFKKFGINCRPSFHQMRAMNE